MDLRLCSHFLAWCPANKPFFCCKHWLSEFGCLHCTVGTGVLAQLCTHKIMDIDIDIGIDISMCVLNWSVVSDYLQPHDFLGCMYSFSNTYILYF